MMSIIIIIVIIVYKSNKLEDTFAWLDSLSCLDESASRLLKANADTVSSRILENIEQQLYLLLQIAFYKSSHNN